METDESSAERCSKIPEIQDSAEQNSGEEDEVCAIAVGVETPEEDDSAPKYLGEEACGPEDEGCRPEEEISGPEGACDPQAPDESPEDDPQTFENHFRNTLRNLMEETAEGGEFPAENTAAAVGSLPCVASSQPKVGNDETSSPITGLQSGHETSEFSAKSSHRRNMTALGLEAILPPMDRFAANQRTSTSPITGPPLPEHMTVSPITGPPRSEHVTISANRGAAALGLNCRLCHMFCELSEDGEVFKNQHVSQFHWTKDIERYRCLTCGFTGKNYDVVRNHRFAVHFQPATSRKGIGIMLPKAIKLQCFG